MVQGLALLPAAEARRLLADTEPVGVEPVPLTLAAGRVLAEDLRATEDLPGWARSAMDGYAVVAADVAGAGAEAPGHLTVVGQVPMGGVWPGRVASGEAVGISTGGALPEGADAVVMVEYTSVVGAALRVTQALAAGANVVQRGEDLRAGQALLPAGRRVRPADVAVLAALGRTELRVHRRPRVAVLSTGNELVPPDAAPGPGQVRDMNQLALAAQVAAAGCEVTRAGIVRDDVATLRAALLHLLPEHDVVILSGGSSVGVRDVSAEVLGALGPPGILLHGINVRPGKPTMLARVGSKAVLGLPGHPTSALVIFDVFVRPMLWRLGGERGRPEWPARRTARLARACPSVPGREDWIRVRLIERDGSPWAEPLPGGSATVSNVVFADGLVVVSADAAGPARGDLVDVLLYG